MPRLTRVFKILIASPSDVSTERNLIEKVIQDWNDQNFLTKNVLLFPLRWEKHVPTMLNISPQEEVNKRIVDQCDLAVGLLWSRIGSPTDFFEGGTVEELARVGMSNKRVMLYHSRIGVPYDHDPDQFARLRLFVAKQSGLVSSFNDHAELEKKFSWDLNMHISELLSKEEDTPPPPPGQLNENFKIILARTKRNVRPMEIIASGPDDTKVELQKIRELLRYMERDNQYWLMELRKGLEVNLFQQAFDQTLPNINSKKYMYNKITQLLPRIFHGHRFRLYKDKSIENPKSPKIGLEGNTTLKNYEAVDNIPFPPRHSKQGYILALQYRDINLPYDTNINKVIDVIYSKTSKINSKEEIIQSLINQDFEKSTAKEIFKSLEKLELITKIKDNDHFNNKNYEIPNTALDSLQDLINKIQEKIESVIDEAADPIIIRTLFQDNK